MTNPTLAARFIADPAPMAFEAPYDAVQTFGYDTATELRFPDGSEASTRDGVKWIATPLRLTLKLAQSALRAIEITLTKRDGEYRVNFRGGLEPTASYTDDLRDAYGTGVAMRDRVNLSMARLYEVTQGAAA